MQRDCSGRSWISISQDSFQKELISFKVFSVDPGKVTVIELNIIHCFSVLLFLCLFVHFYWLLSSLRLFWIYTWLWISIGVLPYRVHSRQEALICVTRLGFQIVPAVSLKSFCLLKVSIFTVIYRIVWVIWHFIGLAKKPYIFLRSCVQIE